MTDGTNTFNLYIVVKQSGSFDSNLPLNSSDYIFVGDQPLVSGTTYTFTGNFNNNANVSYTSFEPANSLLVCFGSETLIGTPEGERKICELSIGDTVKTLSGQNHDIRWIRKQSFSETDLLRDPSLRPIKFSAGSLGNNLPSRDLFLSRQHRVLVSSKIVARVTGHQEALVAAIHLVGLSGISVEIPAFGFEYYHFLLDAHELIFAEGVPAESLLIAEQSARVLPSAIKEKYGRQHMYLKGKSPTPRNAANIPAPKIQKQIASRHRKNKQPLLGREYDRPHFSGPPVN